MEPHENRFLELKWIVTYFERNRQAMQADGKNTVNPLARPVPALIYYILWPL
jgi:hypothetical protein